VGAFNIPKNVFASDCLFSGVTTSVAKIINVWLLHIILILPKLGAIKKTGNKKLNLSIMTKHVFFTHLNQG
jgi:hypothetical protein